MSKLSQYGGRMIQADGQQLVELIDPNDNAKRRYQYRRAGDGGIERRVLQADGSVFLDTGSPWEPLSDEELISMWSVRGNYHPILDTLGL